MAYVALYDAARKAISGHMQASGYRTVNRAGAHHAVGMYAEAVLATPVTAAHVRRFDHMRQIRNRTEYEGYAVGEQMVLADLEHARAVVTVAEAALPPRV